MKVGSLFRLVSFSLKRNGTRRAKSEGSDSSDYEAERADSLGDLSRGHGAAGGSSAATTDIIAAAIHSAADAKQAHHHNSAAELSEQRAHSLQEVAHGTVPRREAPATIGPGHRSQGQSSNNSQPRRTLPHTNSAPVMKAGAQRHIIATTGMPHEQAYIQVGVAPTNNNRTSPRAGTQQPAASSRREAPSHRDASPRMAEKLAVASVRALDTHVEAAFAARVSPMVEPLRSLLLPAAPAPASPPGDARHNKLAEELAQAMERIDQLTKENFRVKADYENERVRANRAISELDQHKQQIAISRFAQPKMSARRLEDVDEGAPLRHTSSFMSHSGVGGSSGEGGEQRQLQRAYERTLNNLDRISTELKATQR
jgi:hypothetical protein